MLCQVFHHQSIATKAKQKIIESIIVELVIIIIIPRFNISLFITIITGIFCIFFHFIYFLLTMTPMQRVNTQISSRAEKNTKPRTRTSCNRCTNYRTTCSPNYFPNDPRFNGTF